jgi:transcriptional regulator
MIYTPPFYKITDSEIIFNFIQKYSFATLISEGDEGLIISHLPLLLTLESKKHFLLGHCAKANPHWRQFNKKVTVIFQGPHTYISPAWYVPKEENVPTWNYVAVHVEGLPTVIEDPRAAFSVLDKTVQFFENEYQTGWNLPSEQNNKISAMLNAIVAFKIEIVKIDAKFKLSQKQESADRENVILELSKRDYPQVEVAKLMRKIAVT